MVCHTQYNHLPPLEVDLIELPHCFATGHHPKQQVQFKAVTVKKGKTWNTYTHHSIFSELFRNWMNVTGTGCENT